VHHASPANIKNTTHATLTVGVGVLKMSHLSHCVRFRSTCKAWKEEYTQNP
ncbi:hypothetical protein NDU88_004016, partial [Pleurodeles waltl]